MAGYDGCWSRFRCADMATMPSNRAFVEKSGVLLVGVYSWWPAITSAGAMRLPPIRSRDEGDRTHYASARNLATVLQPEEAVFSLDRFEF